MSDTEESLQFSTSTVKRTLSTSWRVFTIIWTREKKLLLGSSILRLLPVGLPFINAYIYKLIIDEIVKYVQHGTFDESYFYWLFFARTVSFFASDVSSRIEIYVSHHLWTRVPIIFQDMMLTKISHLDIQYFEDSEFKNLLEKSRDGLTYRPQNLVMSIMSIFEGGIQVLIASVALYKLNAYLIIIIAIIAILELIVQTRLSKMAWGIWNWKSPMKKRYWDLLNILQDARSITETKLFNLADTFLKEVHTILVNFYTEDSKHAKKNLLSQTGLNVVSSISYIGIEIYTISLVFKKRITIGDIGFYTNIISSFRGGINRFLRSIGTLFDVTLYLETIFQILDTQPKIIVAENPVRLQTNTPPRIEFRHVDFVYPGTSEKILDDFNLVIEPGQKIALVGENGAGKSTIIKLLARLYDTTSGEIRINDVNIKDVSLEDWHRNLGVLFQNFNRYNYTVSENIWMGDVTQSRSESKITKAAKNAAAHEFIEKYEKAYDQMLGRTFDEGIEPSGGQWQKIAIARAFFRDAPILILDEPTASIDAKAEMEIFDRVEALSANKTTIIISHRFSTVRKADLIYVIEHGKIIEQGSHTALIQKKGHYQKLFALQAKGYEA